MTLRAEGFVLAGGRSSRMGRDKALVVFNGEPLIARALGILEIAGVRARIAGMRVELGSFAEGVADAEPGQGPLGGICAALEACEQTRAVFLPVDMPLMAPELVRALIECAERENAAVALATLGGEAQSFPAVVARAALHALRTELAAGRLAWLRAVEKAAAAFGERPLLLAAEELAAGAPLAREWFFNLNSEEDVLRTEALLDARPRGLKG